MVAFDAASLNDIVQMSNIHYVSSISNTSLFNRDSLHLSVSLADETFIAYDFLKIASQKIPYAYCNIKSLHHINIFPQEVKTERISNPQFHAIKIPVS